MCERSFNVGNLVLRRIQDTKGTHKLSAPWEGPFIVMEVVGLATYRLQWADGKGVLNAWNINTYTTSTLEDVYQNKRLCTLSLCNFHLIKKETLSDIPIVDQHLGLPFYFLFLPFPLEMLRGLV
jgi:hypothetical protein